MTESKFAAGLRQAEGFSVLAGKSDENLFRRDARCPIFRRLSPASSRRTESHQTHFSQHPHFTGIGRYLKKYFSAQFYPGDIRTLKLKISGWLLSSAVGRLITVNLYLDF